MPNLAKSKPNPATVDQVLKWVLSGASEHEIAEAIKETYPKDKPEPLIIAAMTKAAGAANADPDTVRGWCFEATRMVYQQAIAAKDFGAALRAIKQIRELSKA